MGSTVVSGLGLHENKSHKIACINIGYFGVIKFQQQDCGGGEAFLTRMLMPVLYSYSCIVYAENRGRKQQSFYNPLFAMGEIR